VTTVRVKKKRHRRQRRAKLRYLRARIREAKDGRERQQLATKMKRISRDAPVPEA
jgi:hypothetical protein